MNNILWMSAIELVKALDATCSASCVLLVAVRLQQMLLTVHWCLATERR